jgi:hypothetical protein
MKNKLGRILSWLIPFVCASLVVVAVFTQSLRIKKLETQLYEEKIEYLENYYDDILELIEDYYENEIYWMQKYYEKDEIDRDDVDELLDVIIYYYEDTDKLVSLDEFVKTNFPELYRKFK